MRLGSLWEKKASQTEVGWRKAIVPPEILQCCTEQLWSPNPQAWALNVYSTRVHTEQTGVQVSYFGAALCWESKQSCLYSLNADDEWADGMNRLSVISTWSYREILHRLWMTKGGQGVDGWGGGGGVWGVRQCAVMCCTMHHPRRPAGLRSTLQSLCLFRLCLHSLRSQSELTRLPPLDFFSFLLCSVQFSFLSWVKLPQRRHSEQSGFPAAGEYEPPAAASAAPPSPSGLVSSCSDTQRTAAGNSVQGCSACECLGSGRKEARYSLNSQKQLGAK